MKKDIHPEYHSDLKVVCNACGAEFLVGSTKEKLDIFICSKCHPAYTQKQGIYVDSANRIAKYQQREAKRKAISSPTPTATSKSKSAQKPKKAGKSTSTAKSKKS